MAFFGADGLEHQIKQLKAVIAQKDSQLTTLLNEQHKKGELFDENKRAKDDALYRVQAEADRADKAEKALALKSAELSNTLMKLSNAESTVNANNERKKKDEKEIERLQYELDSRLSSSSTSQSRVQEAHSALQSKIKSLEAQLQRVEAEKESLKVDASFADRNAAFRGHVAGGEREKDTVSGLERLVADLRQENIKLIEENRRNGFTSDIPSAPVALCSPQISKRRRRSLSFNGDSRIQQLQDEIEDLKDQLSRGADYAEVDKLKENLANVKKQALKLENEKMALERSSNKAIEAMQTQLESTNEELEYLRHNGSGEATEELETLKKSAKREKESLEGRIASLKEELSIKTASLARVEKRLEGMEDELQSMQALLAAARQAEKESEKELRTLQQQPRQDEGLIQEKLNAASHQITKLEVELSSAQERLDSMSQELKRAKTAPANDQPTGTTSDPSTSTSLAHFEKTIRKLQREVSALSREKEALQANLQENDDLLAEKEEQIFALQTRIPMPSSPVKGGQSDEQLAVMANALKERDEQVLLVQTQRAELEERLRLQDLNVVELNERISALVAELDTAKAAMGEAETIQQSLHQIEQELHSSQEELRRKECQLESLIQEVEGFRASSQTAEGSQDEKRILEATIQELQARIHVLSEVEVELREAQAMLSNRSYSNTDVESIKQELGRLEMETNRLQTRVEALEAEEFVARQGKEVALERVSQLESHIKAFEEQLAHDEEVYDKIVSELKEEKANVDMKLAKALTEHESLQSQLQDAQEILANRSSATEAGERDIALLQAQAREAELQTKIKHLRDEFDSIENMSSMKLAEAERRESHLEKELQNLRSEHALSVDHVQSLQSTVDMLQSKIQTSIEEAEGHAEARQRLTEVETMLRAASETEDRHYASAEYDAAVIRELRQEVDELSRMLDFAEIEYEVLLEASEKDQQTHDLAVNDLQQRLSALAAEAEQQLETRRIDNENAKETLEKEITAIRDNLSVVELSLQESLDGLQASEDRARKLRMLLQEREKEVTLLKTSMAEIGQPVDNTVLRLREEIAALEARIERRNRQIALEQEKARKLELNLQLAQETLEEQESTTHDLKRDIATFEQQELAYQERIILLNNENTELVGKIQRSTEDAACREEESKLLAAGQREELLQSEITQHHLILQLLLHRSKGMEASLNGDISAKKVNQLLFDVSAARTRLRQLTSMLRKTVAQHEEERRESEVVISTLHHQRHSLDNELDEMRADLAVVVQEKKDIELSAEQSFEELSQIAETHRMEAASAQNEVTSIRDETTSLTKKLNEVENDKKELVEATSEAQDRILQLERSLADTNHRLNENRSAWESQIAREHQQSQFAKELDSARAECIALQATIGALEQELSDAKNRHESGLVASRETQAVLVLAKEAAEDEVARRASEHNELRVEREALLTQIAQLQQALNHQQEVAKTSEQRWQQDVDDIHRKHEITKQQLTAVTGQISQLEATLVISESRCEQLTGEMDHAQGKLAAVEEENDTIQRHLTESQQQKSVLEHRVNSLEATVAALQENETRLIAEYEGSRNDVTASSASLAELQDALQARQLDIESLRTSHAEATRQLQVALEETKRELELAQEGHRIQSGKSESIMHELEEAKGTLFTKTEELQNLVARTRETENLLGEARQTALTLTKERDDLAAEIADFSNERKEFNARLEAMNNEMEEHMENLREAQKAKTSAQRKLEKLERKLKALGETSNANIDKSKTMMTGHPGATGTTKGSVPLRQVAHDVPAPVAAPSSGRKRARETEQQTAASTPPLAAVFAPSPFERTSRSPIKQLPGGRTAFTPNRTPNRPMMFAPTDENLGSKPSAFTPKMRILSDPSPFAKTTPGSTFADEKLATLRTKLADMRTQNM